MNILLTGGASGLGKAITCKLASVPTNTIYFTYCKSKDAAKDIELRFPNTKAIQCDFTNQCSIDNLCDLVPELQLDVLLNNAHTPIVNNHFHKLEPKVFISSFGHNILPMIQITQKAIASFRKKRAGKIITITTAFLMNKPPLGLSAYVAEKAYLTSLSKAWANENAAFNITSNCIAPAMMLTQFTCEIDERVIENAINSHPFKRLLTPDETADTIWLLLQTPQHVNGVTLTINAGMDVI